MPTMFLHALPMPQHIIKHLPHSENALNSSLDELNVGIELWDRRHQLLWNSMDGANGNGGKQHTDPIEAEVFGAGVANAIKRRCLKNPIGKGSLQQLPGDRWIKTFEVRAPNGHLLVVRVNVTALVRQGQLLENSNRRLNELSVTDSLTGLANRRCFDDVLLSEWQRATRNQTDLALVMVDIDHFKKYNDNYGHLAGDECLRRVADVLRRCTRRAGELASRFGGEEFVMVLPGSNREHALEVADLCTRLIKLEGIPHIMSPIAPFLTVSAGVACLQDHEAQAPSDLINASDAAMYRAKSAGRACYELATTRDWEMSPQTPRTTSAHEQGVQHQTPSPP